SHSNCPPQGACGCFANLLKSHSNCPPQGACGCFANLLKSHSNCPPQGACGCFANLLKSHSNCPPQGACGCFANLLKSHSNCPPQGACGCFANLLKSHSNCLANAKLAIIDEMERAVCHMFITAAERSIPKRTIRTTLPHRIKPAVLYSLRRYRAAQKMHKRKKDARSLSLLLSAKHSWQDACALQQKRVWQKRIDKISTNSKVNWKAFGNLGQAEPFPFNSISKSADKLPSSDAETLNNLAEHFADVCTLHDDPDHCSLPEINATLAEAEADTDERDDNFSFEDVQRVCQNPKKLTSAPGPDGIHAAFLKHATPAAIRLLTDLFNATWRHSVLPQQWRCA